MDNPISKMDNVELITHYMNYCKAGAMGQLVLLHAMESYCRAVVAEDKQPDDWPNYLSWESWKLACQDYLDTIAQRDGQEVYRD